ncbi:lysine transporter LysE [Pseudomonas sp. Leaf127]|uniref:LysE family translocator n=1 Tax=Pseudomonas TaxID=286 RepID=UPI000703177B|nr:MULTISPECIES: LysE family translocator [Pseudomonas]KQQ60282.1 lysine transporter LysE [Pseudomonas sp. Leaf127]MBD8494437.1 LysE family translocator [Pseudomonas syringae]
MVEPSTLLLFAGAVLLLLMSPGPNMAFVLAHGASYGWRGGVAAALGISAADLVLTALTAAGVTAAIAQWPPSFDLIRWAGVFYLLWMAWKALRVRATGPLHTALQASLMSVFMRAMLNSLLNPKALLFFMVFLPQFVVPGSSSVARQIVTLGLVLTLIATFFHIALGLVGGVIRGYASGKGESAKWQSWGLAGVLVLLAVRLVFTSRPA